MSKRKSATVETVTQAAGLRDPDASQIWCHISDFHYNITHWPTYRAICSWIDTVRPDVIVANGDMVDLGMLSKYKQGEFDPLEAIEQVRMFVAETNWMRERCGRLIFQSGNHESRWSAVIGSSAAAGALKGAKGLTLEDQCRAWGLRDDVEWVEESTKYRGVRCGQFVIRHGHRQSGPHGGPKHLTANAITKTMGASTAFGHHHRAAMTCQTSLDRTAIAVANPSCVLDQEYHPDSDHQLGFSLFELMAPDFKVATPHLIIALDGKFSHAGLTYDGNV